ncbi:conserved hypothetical protein [Arthrobacter sp. 9AX]|uniref:DUF4862 family protein n=1 Tax=Arthrobacter sp. 9AX TaxID=2653131 RepID=UPI0012F1CD3B|nr:DUF4862 family protein [Arthrobacter sp. 9AX]VXC16669.1 conserved hypothetical protein [Arthrobacter sp. 9AX]
MSGGAGLIVSAYAAAPALDGWDPKREAAFLSAAAALPHVAGLEIPLYATGELHKYDGGWFLEQVRHLPDHFSYIITTIPDTMDRLGTSADFGLASTTAAGKRAALSRVSVAAAAVRTLNAALGGKEAVRAVHLFSAPRYGAGHATSGFVAGVRALASSLEQVADYDWDGAQPVLEHCDVATDRWPAVKGFLPLEAEVEAVLRSGTGAGIAVNWGRTVIETRDACAPVQHVELALREGVLAGAVLSGSSPEATGFGEGWDDCHLPPAPVEPASLLTPQHVRSLAAVLDTASAAKGSDVYRGLKVSAPPRSLVSRRVDLLARSIRVVRGAGF